MVSSRFDQFLLLEAGLALEVILAKLTGVIAWHCLAREGTDVSLEFTA